MILFLFWLVPVQYSAETWGTSCSCRCHMGAAALLLQACAGEQQRSAAALLKSTRGSPLLPCSTFHQLLRGFKQATFWPQGHSALTGRPLCHMEKYSTRDLNVNTSLVSFCSGQAFNRNSSCASSPLGPGKRKDIIQIIKSVRRGRRIVRNSANITRL